MSGMIALFSGQGSQYPGMGKDMYNSIPAVREVYECAGDIMNFDVAKASFESTAEQLARTLISQPVIFTLSVAAFTAAKDIIPSPEAVAGHSLGEFAALWCAGAYSLEDGFRIIKARAAAMDAAALEAAGAMYAIIGLDEETVSEICTQTEGYVVPANFNLPSQTVISGEETAVVKAAATLEEKGARTVRLGVSSAFHTKMMTGAAERFKHELSGISFSTPSIDFYSNLTGRKHEIEDFPAYFAAHMVSPVRFTDEVSVMTEDGLDICVEFGPGKTGSTLVKKNNKAFKVMNIEDMKGLRALEELYKKS